MVYLGNSLTAGFGLDISEAYPTVLQRKVDKLGWPVRMVNAGVSGDTSAGGLRRLSWIMQSHIDVLVIALGGNDGLRGLPPEDTRANLLRMIQTAKTKFPDLQVVVAGMEMPPNLGEHYTSAFRAIFPGVAEETQSHLIPFLLEDVGGLSELNQADGIHPTAEGQQILAENVWEVLAPVLEKLLSR